MVLRIPKTDERYAFRQVGLAFDDGTYKNPFEIKNNRTLKETIQHPRYSNLRKEVENRYSEHLGQPLGRYLGQLKRDGDSFYLRFLNKYGDGEYSAFRITDIDVLYKRGIYAYTVDGKLKYIGRCRDSMKKRVNQGYGKIHPKNCYLDGQATNCHLNALITAARENVRLWFCELDLNAIEKVEKDLIGEYKPDWNISI